MSEKINTCLGNDEDVKSVVGRIFYGCIEEQNCETCGLPDVLKTCNTDEQVMSILLMLNVVGGNLADQIFSLFCPHCRHRDREECSITHRKISEVDGLIAGKIDICPLYDETAPR